MTDFEFGDVVLVPFPFTDQSSIKKRPAVVVSSATYNRDRPDIIILAVTSQIAAPSQIGTFLVQDRKVVKEVSRTFSEELGTGRSDY